MARTSIESDAAPEAVWSVLADADAYGEWVVGTKSIARAAPRWPEPGTAVEYELGVGPIGVGDRTVVVEYLAAAADADVEGSPVVEIGGAEQVTYRRLLEEYARAAGARRATVLVPVPGIAASVAERVAGPVAEFLPGDVQETLRLLESLRHTTVVRDRSADVCAVRPGKLRPAIEAALAGES